MILSLNIKCLVQVSAVAFFVLLCPTLALAEDIDTDRDGLTDGEEAVLYTDPTNPDTDGDGFYDGVEVEFDYSPHLGDAAKFHEHDYDEDGLNDWLERWFGSDIGKIDTDRDGVSDFDEVMQRSRPNEYGTIKLFDKRIEVDLDNQRLYVYVDNVKVMNFPVSTGNPSTPTPPGEYEIQRMIAIADYRGDDYFLPDVQWNMQFIPSYYIHGAYWHNDFGKRTHSHGCVNMRNEDAGLLYKYVDVGTKVTIVGETPKRFWVGS